MLTMQKTDIEREIRAFLVDTFLFGRKRFSFTMTRRHGQVIDSKASSNWLFFFRNVSPSSGRRQVTTENLDSVNKAVAMWLRSLAARPRLRRRHPRVQCPCIHS